MQDSRTTEYYTEMKGLWEELESLGSLPVLSKTDGEIKGFLEALHKQQEEFKLFQFLNGLEEAFGRTSKKSNLNDESITIC